MIDRIRKYLAPLALASFIIITAGLTMGAGDRAAPIWTEWVAGNLTRHVESGSKIAFESGATIDIESGGSFELAGTAVTSTAAELNKLDGVTATTAELNILAGVTATTAEVNALDLSAVGGLVKVKKIALAASDGSEQDSSWDLPAKAIVLDAWVDVTTAEATGSTKTIDIGLLAGESGGNADGFLDGVSTAATGIQKGIVTWTTGSNETYAASTTRGVLLENFLAGADVSLDVGHASDSPHLGDSVTAKSISYSAGSAQTEFVGNLYILYMEIG